MGAGASSQQVEKPVQQQDHHHHHHQSQQHQGPNPTPAIANVDRHIFQAFPCWFKAQDFMKHSYELLNPHGFNNTNTLPCASLCRDELTANFMDIIDEGTLTKKLQLNINYIFYNF